MADNHSLKVRSYNMSRIRSNDTKPEVLVRKRLFAAGFRYRKHDKRYPGTPDIVLPKYRTVIFVHGCFWHMHEGHSCFVMPKSNTDYWIPKLDRNRKRDAENIRKLESMGWNVIVVWECSLKKNLREDTLCKLIRKIRENIRPGS